MRSIISKHKILGSSRYWEVAEYSDGSYSCNCPAWIFHRGTKVDCKHILEYKRHQTLIIQGLDAKNEISGKNEAHNSVIVKENDVVNDLLCGKKEVFENG